MHVNMRTLCISLPFNISSVFNWCANQRSKTLHLYRWHCKTITSHHINTTTRSIKMIEQNTHWIRDRSGNLWAKQLQQQQQKKIWCTKIHITKHFFPNIVFFVAAKLCTSHLFNSRNERTQVQRNLKKRHTTNCTNKCNNKRLQLQL